MGTVTMKCGLTHREPLRSKGLDKDGLAGAGEVGHGKISPYLKLKITALDVNQDFVKL